MPGSTIVCLGGAHMDRTAVIRGTVKLAASNPVTTRSQVGGVACNVARNLARLEHHTTLVTLVGVDAEGDAVADAVAEAGADGAGIERSDRPTGSYLVVLDEAGELVIGLADMEIYDDATPAYLARHESLLRSANAVVLDANLPAETLTALPEILAPGQPLYAAAVSPAKAPRLKPLLPRLAGLFANRREASVLVGGDPDGSTDGLDLATRLCTLGPAAAFVTLGPEGAAAATGSYCKRLAPPQPNPLRDVNGAGDGFMAGAVDALLHGRSGAEAIREGLAVASLTCESTEAASSTVTRQSVATRAGIPSISESSSP